MQRPATSIDRRQPVNPLPSPPPFANAGFESLLAASDRRPSRRLELLDADLLASAIGREQKRVDRSDRAFGVLTVKLTGKRSEPQLQAAAEVLSSATRAGDSVGWHRRGESIAVLMCDMHELSFAETVDVENRLRSELKTVFGDADARRLSVQMRVHSSTRRHAEPARVIAARRNLNEVLKRTLDMVGSVSLLILLAPVLVVTAVAVKLSSKGPVLFRQERVGQGMKAFTMLKFRTMRADAGHAVHQAYVTAFITGGEAAAAAPGVFKLTNDDRITPIGRFLRKTSFDELPQLWNVVRGDMSLVGPRPPLKYEVDQYKGWHRRRVLDAKPGLTGLWQVTGRSRTTFDEMVRLDLRYARTSSLWTDLKILAATPRAVIAGKGAC
jgi:lipopolysaccharide/colanic/teichoic acid biosynthesis glycosyltransferase